jgi:hypothetical protein
MATTLYCCKSEPCPELHSIASNLHSTAQHSMAWCQTMVRRLEFKDMVGL